MRKLLMLAILIQISCSSSNEKEAWEYYSSDFLIQKSTYRMQESMNYLSTSLKNVLMEVGKNPEKDSIYLEFNDLISNSRQFSGFIKEWRQEIIDATGGMNEKGLPIGLDSKVDIQESMPANDFDFVIPALEKLKVSIALISLSKLENEFISSIHNHIQEEMPNIEYLSPGELSYQMVLNKNKNGVLELIGFDHLPFNEIDINGKNYTTDGNSISFSKQEWSEMDARVIKIDLTDSAYTFNLIEDQF